MITNVLGLISTLSLIVNLFFCIRKKVQKVCESMILAMTSVIIVAGLFILSSASLNVYSFNVLIVFEVCSSIFIMIINISCGNYKSYGKTEKNDVKEIFFLTAIFLISFFLYSFYRINWIRGFRDPSCYYLLAIRISETGSVYEQSSTIFTLNYDLIHSMTNNVTLSTADKITSFLPLTSCIFSIGYSLLGKTGLLMMNPLIASLSILVFYMFVKAQYGIKTGIAAALMLMINPAQIWNARIPQSEMFCQMLLFVYLYLLSLLWEKNKILNLFLCGGIISIAHLARIDMHVLGIAVCVFFVYHALFSETSEFKKAFALMGGYYSFSVIAFVWAGRINIEYYDTHWFGRENVLKLLIYANIFCIALCILTVLIRKLHRVPFPNIISNPIQHKEFAYGIAFLIICMVFYAYYFRPFIEGATYKSYTLKTYFQYVNPFLILLAIIGITFVCLTDSKHWKIKLLFLLIGGMNTVLYIAEPSIVLENMWMSRRWITISIPFVIIMSVYGIKKISEVFIGKCSLAKILALGVFFSVCCSLKLSEAFIFTSIYPDIEQQYTDLMSSIEVETIYFTDNRTIYWVLHYYYGLEVYEVDFNITIFEYPQWYLNGGKEIMLIGSDSFGTNMANQLNCHIQLMAENQIIYNHLRSSAIYIPHSFETELISANIFKLYK